MLVLLVGRPGRNERIVSNSKGPHILKGFAFHRRKLASASAAVLAVGASAGFISTAAASATSGTLNGAGSTLVAPLEAEWASAFNSKTGNTVNYNPVGSGTGIAEISSGVASRSYPSSPMTNSRTGLWPT